MSDVDISTTTNETLVGQSEAVENLNVAEKTNITTDIVEDLSPSSKSAAMAPKEISEGVARTMSKSRMVASTIEPEAKQMSDAEKWGRTFRLNVDGSDISSQLGKKGLELMDYEEANPGKPIPEELDFENTALRMESDRIVKELSEIKPSLMAQGAAAMFSSFRDTAKSAADKLGIVAAGAGTGAAIGMFGGPAGSLSLGVAGALTTAQGVAAFDNIQRMRGETYVELSNATVNNKPVKMSPEAKRYISNSIGVLGGAVEYGLEKLMLSKIPGIGGLFNPKKMAAEVAKNPALRDTMVKFGKGIAANITGEGAVEGIQYNLDIFADEIGKAWDGSYSSLGKAFTNIMNRPEYAEGLVKQVSVGAIAGGMGATVLGVPGSVHERVKVQINKSKTDKAERKRLQGVADTMTAAQPGDNGVDQTLTPQPVTPETQKIIVDEGKAKYLNSQQSLTLALVVQNTAETVKESKIDGQLSTAVDLQKQMLQQSGVNQVWVAPEDLNKWADNQEKREKVNKWFGTFDPDLDTRLPVSIDTLAQMTQEDPEFSKVIRHEADAMNFNEMLEYYKDRPDRINRDFIAKGVSPAQLSPEIAAEGVGMSLQPEAEQPVTAGLGPSSSDEDILSVITNKQEANEYLGRLADEEGKLTIEGNEEVLPPSINIIEENKTDISSEFSGTMRVVHGSPENLQQFQNPKSAKPSKRYG